MKVRAKMVVVEKLNRVNQWQPGSKPTCHVKLAPAQGEENKTWAKYTPAGSIELQIDNPPAYDAFVLGQSYFVDFTPAPTTEAEEAKGAEAPSGRAG